MSNMLKKLEKAFYMTLFILGVFFIFSGLIGSSILNLIVRITIGSLIALGVLPEISTRIDRKTEVYTLKTLRIFKRFLTRVKAAMRKGAILKKYFKREVSSEADITNT